MKKKILNITNGDCFNEYFLSHYIGKAVPLCEAMMDGDSALEIYSDKFILLRAQSLNVSPSKYREKMYVYQAMHEDTYDEIHLWFGKDTFCQVNLLMLLAFLEESAYEGRVILNYIDDETFQVLEKNICVELGPYKNIYQEVLIEKRFPKETGVLLSKAIDLYFDYHSESGFLSKLVFENLEMDKTKLLCLLLEKSKEYGLSDQEAEKIILKVKNKVGEKYVLFSR